MINKVELIGNLGAGPEIRTISAGDRVANLRIATSQTWRDRDSGERREKTEWHRVSIWGEHNIKYLETYAEKGTLVRVEGMLETRKWNDGGQDRYSTQIVVKGRNGEVKILARFAGSSDEAGDGADTGQPASTGAPRESFSADLDDEPF